MTCGTRKKKSFFFIIVDIWKFTKNNKKGWAAMKKNGFRYGNKNNSIFYFIIRTFFVRWPIKKKAGWKYFFSPKYADEIEYLIFNCLAGIPTYPTQTDNNNIFIYCRVWRASIILILFMAWLVEDNGK